jgi:putative DNA primase/helicase
MGLFRSISAVLLPKKYGEPTEADKTRSTELAARGMPIKENRLCTDTRNGKEFAADHGESIRYVPEWGWLRYDEKRWAPANYEEMMALAKKTAERMLRDAARTKDHEAQTRQLRHAVKTLQVPFLKRMLEAARSEDPILARVDDFDRDPLTLNCENGALDLRNGQLWGHEEDQHLTKLAKVNYEPTATAPLWEKFLAEVLPDQSIRSYLQRWLGYCMTGIADEQAVLFLWGDGQNGKSTATVVPLKILGDYAQTVNASTIIRRSNDGVRNDLACLKDVRYASIAEYPENKPLDEAFIKSATGGENVRARHLYKEFFEFKPTFKAVVTTNTKPIVIGGDHGIWRRIKLIPFTVRIPDDKKDPKFMDKLFDRERSGILNWMLRGYWDWQEQGLHEPPEVTRAVQEYRLEMDVIAHFLNDRAEQALGEETAAADLYGAYQQWCHLNGHRAKSQKTFGTEMTKRGVEKRRDAKGRWTYEKIRLKGAEG